LVFHGISAVLCGCFLYSSGFKQFILIKMDLSLDGAPIEHEFWHLSLKPGQSYKKQNLAPLHISHAVLETHNVDLKDKDGFVQVRVKHGSAKEFTVANLSLKRNLCQVNVDMAFRPKDDIEFRLTGERIPVNLIGLREMVVSESDEESEEDSESELDTSEIVSGKRKAPTANGLPAKKSKQDDPYAKLKNETLPEEDDDEPYNPMADPNLTTDELEKLPINEEETDDSEDESDDEDEDESEEDSDEDVEDKGLSTLNGSSIDYDSEESDDDPDVDMDSSDEESPVKAPPKTEKPMKQASTPKPNTASPKSVKKESKQDLNKSSGQQKSKFEGTPKQAAAKKSSTPAAKEATPKVKDSKKGIMKDTPDKLNKSAVKDSAQKKAASMKAGGVLVEDVSVGSGSPVKAGSMVSMYYKGTLKSNGKQFDAKETGKPFKFRLGKGEVIPGWDVGVAGMKVGGRRKLSIPPKMGYGKKGMGPIPGNAHLNFEVTLVGFN